MFWSTNRITRNRIISLVVKWAIALIVTLGAIWTMGGLVDFGTISWQMIPGQKRGEAWAASSFFPDSGQIKFTPGPSGSQILGPDAIPPRNPASGLSVKLYPTRYQTTDQILP